MPQTIKVRKIGGSLGVLLPKTITDALAIEEGDELFVTTSGDGLTVTPYDPDFSAAMEDAREFMRTHRDAFRELAG